VKQGNPYSESFIVYDGAKLPVYDAITRIKRDGERQRMYRDAENSLDPEQYTLSDVEDMLREENQPDPWFDPSIL
jgi:hypothetical protein